MASLPRIGALDIAEAVAERIGSYVDMSFIQFLAVEGDRVRCWYMNSGGDGPTFEIDLQRASSGWLMTLQEHPPGTEQHIEVP
jgi:hypothetical protein